MQYTGFEVASGPSPAVRAGRRAGERLPHLAFITHQDWASIWSFALSSLVLIITNSAIDTPRDRPYTLYDGTISYPFTETTVPYAAAVIVPLLCFLVTVIAGEFVSARSLQTGRAALLLTVHFTIHLIGCFVISSQFTIVGKALVGRLRPDFLARCQPSGDYTNATLVWGETTSPECMNPTVGAGELRDGHMSFPSGHTSTAFSLSVFSVVYGTWCFNGRTARVKASARRQRTRAIAGFLPALLEGLSLSWLVAQLAFCWGVGISRIIDFKHHPSDVIAGALLGGSFAVFFGYRAIVRVPILIQDEDVDEGTLGAGLVAGGSGAAAGDSAAPAQPGEGAVPPAPWGDEDSWASAGGAGYGGGVPNGPRPGGGGGIYV